MSLVCKKYTLLAVDMILSATDILWEEKRKLSDCCFVLDTCTQLTQLHFVGKEMEEVSC